MASVWKIDWKETSESMREHLITSRVAVLNVFLSSSVSEIHLHPSVVSVELSAASVELFESPSILTGCEFLNELFPHSVVIDKENVKVYYKS